MIYFGADYYPEHWPEEWWAEDVRLMAEAGFNVVRLAEFAWSKMEPQDGRFDFDWLDRAIALLAARGIEVVLGTPTASPPPWLMSKQADLYLINEEGVRLPYGNRREYCPNHPLYHEHSQRIVTAMADHYADNPAVIGWQIDNEFGSRCFCDICKSKFHDWLSTRYTSLEELNKKWGTVFWSHIYNEWQEIPVPFSLGTAKTSYSPNPGLALDYYRFMSDSYLIYQKMQIDILRDRCPNHFITHNLMGFKYKFLNYFDMTEDLDFVSWDNYWRTQWDMRDTTDPSGIALNHDAMRGLKKKNFWVMEHQSGSGGWEFVAIPPKPGELRLYTYQSLAHGADGIVYFRWRTCLTGTEQYWHGVLDHHGIPGRRYDEILQVGRELQKFGSVIAGSQIKPQVAIMQSYDSRFAFQIQGNNPRFSYEQHIQDIYREFFDQNIPVDIISERDPLTNYKLVIVPALYVLPQETALNLENFTAAGGAVVFTPRTGVKDETNTVVNMKLPGLVAKLCGVEVDEYVSMPIDGSGKIQFRLPNLKDAFETRVWSDVLESCGAEVIAVYAANYYAGKPAATRNSFGKGSAIYLGAMGGTDYYKAVIRWLLELVDLAPVLDVPAGVEVMERWQGEQQLLFVLNHTNVSQTIELAKSYTDLISDQRKEGAIELAPHDVLILSGGIGG